MPPAVSGRKRAPDPVTAKVFGRRVARLEDAALITGAGRFVDDISFDGMLHAAFVRSPFAHAAIGSIDKAAALALPGVHAVYTLQDFAPHLVVDRLIVGLPSPAYKQDLNRPALADGEVVGRPDGTRAEAAIVATPDKPGTTAVPRCRPIGRGLTFVRSCWRCCRTSEDP